MSAFNLSALAVRERAITLFLIVAIAAAGIYAFLKLGRAEDPLFTIKQFTVTAVWPGATAKEMQDLVAEPLEKRLQELRYYDRVETTAHPGAVYMTVNLLDSTPPALVQEQFYQARKKIGDETPFLPKGVIGPFVNDEYSDVSFALYALKAQGLPERDLVRKAEALRQDMLHVPGVKKINILGEQAEKIYVEFSYERLAGLGISPQAIFQSLQLQNNLSPAGSIETRGAEVFVRVEGAYDDVQKIKDTPLVAGNKNLKLSDVATVRRGYQDPASFVIRHKGTPSLVLSVVMQDGWNGLNLGAALEAKASEIAASLPLGLTFEKITDQAVNISEAVGEFMLKFFVALGVVLFVSFISLGWRSGIIVAAAIPLTLAIVFVVMLMTDRAFDRITLGALILSLGLLVDDAIIAIEIMVVKLEGGMDRLKAAAYAWSHTAAPMLSGTLVTIVGFMPVGFALSSAGEYAGNIFWIVGFALLASWVVAVVFTPYLGVKLLPNIEPVSGGHHAIYDTPNYRRLRRTIEWAVRHKFLVAGVVLVLFAGAGAGMAFVNKQFFPTSDRPELLVEVQMPEGTSIEATEQATRKVEAYLLKQPEAKVVTAYIGQGAPRFFFSYAPELPDTSFAKIIVLTPDQEARDALKVRLRDKVAEGLVPEGRIRAAQLVFGPYSQFPVAFRIMGPDRATVQRISDEVLTVMRANPHVRTANRDWGERMESVKFNFDQERLKLIGLSPVEAAQQLQFLLSGVPITAVREDIRSVDIVARSDGSERLDPAKLGDFALVTPTGRSVPVDQIGKIEVQPEDPVLKRRDRVPTMTVRSDVEDGLQPPDVSAEISKALQPIIAALPSGYRIEVGADVEESTKANIALAKIFPIMILLTMLFVMLQVRSFSGMWMVLLTAPLGLLGAVPTLLVSHQPFGFNAILALIGLSGILMRNTLILMEQIKDNLADGLDPYHAVVEATVQRSRPVILTALAAVLAFIPLTQSVFWGALAYTLIGGTAVGTVIILMFLPALYAIWYAVKPTEPGSRLEHDNDRSTAGVNLETAAA